MAIEDDIKAAELETRKLEILQRQKDLGEKRRFGLASAAVLVTILGGLAAVLFQGIGFLTSTQDKENAEIAAASDFDFKGLELFVKEQDHLITCDPDESARNLKLFNDRFSKRVTAGFSEVVAYRSQKCIAQSQNSGAAEAEAKTKGAPLSTEEIAAAADVARYAAAALQASLLDASTAANAPARQKYRVFIQINSEADRRRGSPTGSVEFQRLERPGHRVGLVGAGEIRGPLLQQGGGKRCRHIGFDREKHAETGLRPSRNHDFIA